MTRTRQTQVPCMDERFELLTVLNASRLANFARSRDNMKLHGSTVRGLDDALDPLLAVVEQQSFYVQAAARTIDLARAGLREQTFRQLCSASKPLADLESTRPLNRGQNPVLDKTLALHHAVLAADEQLASVRGTVHQALAGLARAIDELNEAVLHRRYEVFCQAVADEAQVAGPLAATSERDPCYLCMEQLDAGQAAWIARPPCLCTASMLAHQHCFVRMLYESTDMAKKSYGACPHCKAEITLAHGQFESVYSPSSSSSSSSSS